MTAATRRPVRIDRPALPSAETLQAELAAAIPDGLWYDDVHGAPDWRRHVTGLQAGRAEAIVAGVVLLIEAMRTFDLSEVEVSEHDILRGAALDRAAAPAS